MNNDIKIDLHKLIDNCENELMLLEVKKFLESENEISDWWRDLTIEEKSLVLESEAEYEKGNFLTNKQLEQEFEAWKKK